MLNYYQMKQYCQIIPGIRIPLFQTLLNKIINTSMFNNHNNDTTFKRNKENNIGIINNIIFKYKKPKLNYTVHDHFNVEDSEPD